MKEIWSNVITTKCPHCKKNSPAFRKDGYTKMFVKPLSGRAKNAQVQSNRLSEAESQTVASTNLHNSRKTSNVDEIEEEDSDGENDLEAPIDDIDEEFKEGGSQKYISPIEVIDHIKKMWQKESDILNLMYGKFEPLNGSTGPFET
jgi:DNA-directed RNA polymerase I subunit RPA1